MAFPISPQSMSLHYHLVLIIGLILVLPLQVVSLPRKNLTGLLGQEGSGSSGDMVMEEEELVGLFEVMAHLLDDPGQEWAHLHPLPCTDTPWPGLQCEIGDDQDQGQDQDGNGGVGVGGGPPPPPLMLFHVTRIHIGPDVASPPCKPSATFPSPASFHKLPYLKTLSIFNCFMTSPVTLSPQVFTGFSSSLEHLSLNSNPSLIGEVPSGGLALVSNNLRVLSLSQNGLHGSIPSEVGRLVRLEQLDLSYNNLSGQIPEEIGRLEKLTILDLSSNGIQGEIPSSLANLELLQKIDLGSNQLSGRVPPELGRLNRLVLLDLSNNLITGPIPPSLSGLVKLQYLTLDNNPLNTEIPLFCMSKLGSLTSMSLSGCGLIGPIPNNLSSSSLSNLTVISLDNNSLTGPIPPSLGSLPSLDQLNVSDNQLSGELLLPEEFISKLGKRLDVRGNKGLCTTNNHHLELNICLASTIATSSTTNKTSHENSKGGGWDQGKTSSSSSTSTSRCCCVWLKLEFLIIFCVLLLLLFFHVMD